MANLRAPALRKEEKAFVAQIEDSYGQTISLREPLKNGLITLFIAPTDISNTEVERFSGCIKACGLCGGLVMEF
ncbi:predicted protein [Sclerotinia sclerotiorum 1980 UF-70]|uniref:Uncharacterized protein n=1 Tax=Sclerotinia sclerotiorum (strain ATCC 18683 / 1980 / Ss-1) TaxID=665079 RepID=A7E916_SCLS1|nr:predicted protein [Sclerotinia sclerotiorum 1980 UF-70]EDN96868.1 predicted protein [Sclerotinia sclerotiorum 1980 UF-70]